MRAASRIGLKLEDGIDPWFRDEDIGMMLRLVVIR